MIADCEAGKIDLILTKNISRFARNLQDSLKYVDLLKKLNPSVGIFFETERLNTLDKSAEMLITLLSLVAQGESESKSNSIKWAIRERFKKGIPLCPTSYLLGYDTNEFKQMVIVDEEAVIVRYIYGNFLEGWTVSKIAQSLTNAKIPTVKGKTIWSTSAIYSILKNEKFCGDVLMQKTVTLDYLTHKSVKNTGQERQYRIREHHPPIISREDWNLVQQQRQVRRYDKKPEVQEINNIMAQIQLIKKGLFKGFIVIDLAWKPKDIEHIFAKVRSKNKL